MKNYKKTPDFGLVTASTMKLESQCYRAVVKTAAGDVVFVSVETFRNRDISSSMYDSARDTAKRFIDNELKAEGSPIYRDGIYQHEYKGPAPFFDLYVVSYECVNGYWSRINDEYRIPTRSIPMSILTEAVIK